MTERSSNHQLLASSQGSQPDPGRSANDNKMKKYDTPITLSSWLIALFMFICLFFGIRSSFAWKYFMVLPLVGIVAALYGLARGFVSRRYRSVVYGIIGLIPNLYFGYFFALHTSPQFDLYPSCHKNAVLGFSLWMADHETENYPNIKGIGPESLAELARYGSYSNLHENYMYVPGLNDSDPPQLVLLYAKRPTRYSRHGIPPPLIFKPKKWIVLGPDIAFPKIEHIGEFNDWIETIEFKARLQNTLDYLRDNNRPFWKNVVAEHTEFLKSIKE